MTTALHRDLDVGEIHRPYQWQYDNSTLREAATGFLVTDVGKLALQVDDKSLWLLSVHSPAAWINVQGPGVPFADDPPLNVRRGSAQAGTDDECARRDHEHDVDVGIPVDIGTANDAGSGEALVLYSHVHNLPFATVQTVLNGATGTVGVNNQRVALVGTPTIATDAATKGYVDGVASGLQLKGAVKAVATSAVASLSGLATTVDGVLLDTDGMRVLLTAQGTGAQNGIWAVHSGAWTRPSDFAAGSHAASAFAFSERGTAYADMGWVCTTNGPSDVVDTDALIWTQFSGAGQINAGAGLTKSGNTLNVVANADGSVTVNADDIQVGILASDAQHGSRGGGSQHAVATTSVNGFLASGDKTKLDGLPSSVPPTTRTITAGAGLVGGGDLSADRTINVGAHVDGSITVGADAIQVGVLASDTQHGSRGGGTQHAVVTTSTAGFSSAADKTKLDGLPTSAPPTTRTVTAGAGLTGGGDLSADRTINVVANADGSITVNADDIQVGTLASDAQHGSRGGGSQHAVATTSTAGFESAADKTKLDGLPTNAPPTTRTITAGLGLTGGGDLSADRTINVGAHADGSIVVAADTVQVGTLASDAQHGSRGGGSQHAVATTSTHGFMSSTDKTKLDGISGGAVFGSEAQNAASEGESTTTQTTYQEKLKLTTSSLSGGVYRVGWHNEMRCSSVANDALYRIQVDDTTTLAEVNNEIGDNANYLPGAGFGYVTLTSGVHTIDMDYRVEGGPGTTAYIRRARIELWKVSL
jgi:hypothetical protein